MASFELRVSLESCNQEMVCVCAFIFLLNLLRSGKHHIVFTLQCYGIINLIALHDPFRNLTTHCDHTDLGPWWKPWVCGWCMSAAKKVDWRRLTWVRICMISSSIFHTWSHEMQTTLNSKQSIFFSCGLMQNLVSWWSLCGCNNNAKGPLMWPRMFEFDIVGLITTW